MRQLQQGDVLLNQVKRIPGGAEPLDPRARGYVLADGEVTGHAHTIADVEAVELYEVKGTLYLKVLTPTPLTHEEHGTVDLPAGAYEIGQVVEVDPFEKAVRPVID
ncbi:unnamed protein product [marine sediment metagenome]|uniref:Uncharacterized protein n=1 Tax=marine sediment metagenome TaxID=412755 RepID=X0ZBB7_9ZZZZ